MWLEKYCHWRPAEVWDSCHFIPIWMGFDHRNVQASQWWLFQFIGILLFSSAAHEDTVACWQKQLENFLSVDTAVYRYGNECIAEFGEDTEETPPLRKLVFLFKFHELFAHFTSFCSKVRTVFEHNVSTIVCGVGTYFITCALDNCAPNESFERVERSMVLLMSRKVIQFTNALKYEYAHETSTA